MARTFIQRKLINLLLRCSGIIPKKLYLSILFRLTVGYSLNLKSPKSFNEKLQWLKLYWHDEICPIIVDKYRMKEYVSQILGIGYTFETLALWDNPYNIDFDVLPNRFVLKTTHGGGGDGVIICKNKSEADIEKIKKRLFRACKQDIGGRFLEWPYKEINPRIIAEPFMEDANSKELIDYKVHCFNGVPHFILVCSGRFSDEGLKDDFYDIHWQRLQCSRPAHPNSNLGISKPLQLEEMLSISSKLSKSFPFLRVDFYIVNNTLFIGELTLFPASGFSPFIPQDMDYKFGELLTLPNS